MKKEKKIVIKNPKLVQIRNGFRSILYAAIISRISTLNDRDDELVYKKSLTEEEEEEMMINARKKADLRRMLGQSLIKCPSCGQMGSNMAYLPYHRTWFCLECFERLKKHLSESNSIK